MGALPESDLELRKLLSAGFNGEAIAARYNVGPSAVYNRFNRMGISLKGPGSPVSSALPWDIARHPDKRRLTNQAPFRGLRYFLQKRMGEKLSERAELDLRAFLNKVRSGYVLALQDDVGFAYVPREDRDGNLVVRWPTRIREDDPRATLFVDCQSPAEGAPAQEGGRGIAS
ncbi:MULTISPECIES: hypothetical protein [Streptomyces]|uniref:Resolvase HTH domain-containing protein n=2 Tax=Streptomyces TaxID=1883 RepID=A0ABV9IVA5_9ACTN